MYQRASDRPHKQLIKQSILNTQNDFLHWSIGIYTGKDPFHLVPYQHNPILTKHQVTDYKAAFVADPFFLKKDDTYYLFFEVLNHATRKGDIALATSQDLENWTYQKVVLAEPFHLSYPYVFEWEGETYMIPETLGGQAIQLYKAENFPYQWKLDTQLIKGEFADPSIFYFADKWWIFTCTNYTNHDNLRLYFSDNLKGPYQEHPKSPIKQNDAQNSRPAGRVLVLKDKIIRFAQNCQDCYGESVNAFEIDHLTTEEYSEKPLPNNPFLATQEEGWNRAKTHHIDAQKMGEDFWVACVDGNDRSKKYRQ